MRALIAATAAAVLLAALSASIAPAAAGPWWRGPGPYAYGPRLRPWRWGPPRFAYRGYYRGFSGFYGGGGYGGYGGGGHQTRTGGPVGGTGS